MQKRTQAVTFGGKPITLVGTEIKVGDKAPNFAVLAADMTPVSLEDSNGFVRIISVVPSIDTPVCDIQTRWFNQDAAQLNGVTTLTISVDLPFALKRYCGANEITNVKALSDHRDLDFGLKYGFVIEELRLLTRGVIVIDSKGIVRHIQYVPEVKDQPDYDAALQAAKDCM